MKERSSRPWSVTGACAISLTLSAYDMFCAMSGEKVEDMPYLDEALLALNLVPVMFTAAAYLGRRWGRMGLLAVTALGLLAWPLLMLLDEQWVQELGLEALLYSIAGVMVLVLLLLPPSGEWYRRAYAPVEP